MNASPAPAGVAAPPWTCPFCPLLCDGFTVQADAASGRLELAGSDCSRARRGLAPFQSASSPATPAQVDGTACDLAAAVAAAAGRLHASRQPLFAGLGTDVAGARALYPLALETGAISDAANGPALMHVLRALQDRGAFTTTLAEVRTRADLIVCIGGSPAPRLPELWRRCGVGEALVAQRHVVFLGGAADDGAPLQGLPGVSVEHLALQGDLFDTVAQLGAVLASGAGAHPLSALAARLRAARYAVLVWETGRLPSHGALLQEGLNRIVGLINRSTRAAGLPLGGGDGAATANQVFAWLSGLPLRSRAGPLGLEHEPLRFDTAGLLAGDAVDLLLWVSSFEAGPLPPGLRIPHVVLGPPALAAQVMAAGSVFIAVATPGIGTPGHVFRTDGVVLMPLHAVVDQGLPTVPEVVRQLRQALHGLRAGAAA